MVSMSPLFHASHMRLTTALFSSSTFACILNFSSSALLALFWQAKEKQSRKAKGKIHRVFLMFPSDNGVVTQLIASHSGEVNASALGGAQIGLRLPPCDGGVTESTESAGKLQYRTGDDKRVRAHRKSLTFQGNKKCRWRESNPHSWLPKTGYCCGPFKRKGLPKRPSRPGGSGPGRSWGPARRRQARHRPYSSWRLQLR